MSKRQPKLPTELIKGNTKTLVLAILREGPSHGYAITHEIESRTLGAVQFRQGTLYPLLHEMEREGWVLGEWAVFGDERPKKVYTITPAGIEEFERCIDTWNRLSQAIQSVTGVLPHEQTS